MSRMGTGGTFGVPHTPQSQEKPGSVTMLHILYLKQEDTGLIETPARLEKEMAPPSEATKLESGQGFIDYIGSGKLKDKKVIITGGEYVQAECLESHSSIHICR